MLKSNRTNTCAALLDQKFSREQFSDFLLDSYLPLPSVESAYDDVAHREEFATLLNDFARLMFEENLGARYGIFLLHRHFLPTRGTRPIERTMRWGSTKGLALVTQMVSNENIACAPSRWAFDPQLNRFVALEFSADRLVLYEWNQLLERPALMSRVAELLTDSGLTHLLGFAVANRSILGGRPGYYLVESSDVESSASVVRAEPKPEDRPINLIPTVWIPTKSCWCEPLTDCMSSCWRQGSDHVRQEHDPVPTPQHKLVPCM